jgi:hypothetical protein
MRPDDELEDINSKRSDPDLTEEHLNISFKQAFGAFVSELSAEKLAEDIRNSRTFTREIEPLD